MIISGFRVLLVTSLVAVWLAAPAQGQKKMVCYFTNWAQYRAGFAQMKVRNINPFLCTHVVYAFSRIVNDVITTYEENDRTMWAELNALKQQNPNLKTLLAVGGYTHGSVPFTEMASTPSRRARFISSTIQLLRSVGFDGLDIDWEYPSEADKPRLALLLKELREAVDQEARETNREPLLLAAAVAAGIRTMEAAYDVPALNSYLDFISVMAYDYHGSWELFTGPASPLQAQPDDPFSVTWTMNWYLSQGASREKLVVGLAVFGRSWTLKDPTLNTMEAPAITGGAAGEYTRTAGILAYYEVCTLLTEGFIPELDPLSQVMYASKGNQWITYENVATLAVKTNYIINSGFAGAMVWSMAMDDFPGIFCGAGNSPLITSVSQAMKTAPTTGIPTTEVPITQAPPTQAPVTQAPPTQPPVTQAPTTKAPVTQAPPTPAPTTHAPPTQAPVTPVPTTQAPPTQTTPTQAPQPGDTTTVVNGGDPKRETSNPFNHGTIRCTSAFGFLDDPSSCFHYYMCIGAMSMRVKCQFNYVFNPQLQKCVRPSEYSCQ